LAAILERLTKVSTSPCADRTVCQAQICELLSYGVTYVALKRGKEGAIVGTKKGSNAGTSDCQFWQADAPKVDRIVSVNGAGDSFDGAMIWGIISGKDIPTSLQLGITAAGLSLQSEFAVSPGISKETVGN